MQVFAMNASTLAVSEYTGIAPVDFAAADRNLLMLESAGISENVGDTDNEVEIEWSLKTGALNLGIPTDKKITRAYLSVRSSETLLLSATADVRGDTREIAYQVPKRTGEEVELRRVRMAQGVQGHRWTFEVQNTAGGDGEIRSFEVLPKVIRRRP